MILFHALRTVVVLKARIRI